MISEYFLFSVVSVVQYGDESKGRIPVFVYAEDDREAMKTASDYLMSGKSGYKIKTVIRQYLEASSSFIAKDKAKLKSFRIV